MNAVVAGTRRDSRSLMTAFRRFQETHGLFGGGGGRDLTNLD